MSRWMSPLVIRVTQNMLPPIPVRNNIRGLDPLIDFFLREFDDEEHTGFSRISRVPDSSVASRLAYYRSLTGEDRSAFRSCCAYWSSASYGFVLNRPRIDRTKHPFFERWNVAARNGTAGVRQSVPMLRAMVQQYKIDSNQGRSSTVSDEEFAFASSVRSVKAAELRKRVRAALKPLGYYKIDDAGYYHCRDEGREFLVHVDYGGRGAQLRYCVALPEFSESHPPEQFCFERALGFGFGDWDYIVEDNLEDSMTLFTDVVQYCVGLPDRLRAIAA